MNTQNINNSESMNQANGLQSVTIRRESRDNGNAFGRKTLRNVYYRVKVPHYCDALYNHDEELQRKASEAEGVLHYGTMVRMPGVVGGLKVAEIDREGDRVICKSDSERHEYKSIEYFEQTAQEIIIPRWLRIMKYFYIGPKEKEENRVLCTAIEPNNDLEHPVVIHYNVDGEDEDGKIVLTSGLDYYNRVSVAS